MKIEDKKAYIPCEIVENEINNGLDIRVRIDKTHDLYINRKLLIPDIDQPEIEVPQMIFDVIESFDEDAEYLHEHLNHQSDEVREWLTHNERDFYEAWLAYPNITVKKEKLYTVELPDPNSKDTVYCLFKDEDGQVKIGSVLFLETEPDDSWRDDPDMQLTEQEICKDFDWAWQWKKEVTE